VKNKKLTSGFIVFFILSSFWVSCSYFDDLFGPDKHFPIATDILTLDDSSSLDFFIISDWGYNGSINQKEVESEMDLIARHVGLEFILTCGDNFHETGVSSINDLLWQSNFEDVYNDSALLVPWYPALGNHDYIGNPGAQVEYSTTSEYWAMPARYYTFVKNIDSEISARFIVLDTQWLISEYQKLTDSNKYDTIAQYIWLKELLPDVREKWIIVTGHHPIFSASPVHGGDNEDMKTILKPLLDTYNVDFYICGHDHDFEHAREDGKTTDYIVTGTAGFPTPVFSNSRTIYSMFSLGFTYISLSADSAQLYFITADNNIGYSYIREK
jgi:hypothetical protein